MPDKTIRQPNVANQFYPANPEALKRQLAALLSQEKTEKVDAWGLLCPHAGYVFSGKVAGKCFANVKLTDTVVILGPNHTGLGTPFSIMTEGIWQMPLGEVRVDAGLAKQILKGSQYLEEDTQAHLYEHSVEVQLPFLQYLLPKVKIVPIVISSATAMIYEDIGKAIASAIKGAKQKRLIIATSDMTHYQPEQKAKEDDNLAIEAILKLDAEGLLQRIKKFNITMCGYGPAACMLYATTQLGAKTAQLIDYQTSAAASGDSSSVVGYAGIMVK